MRHVVVRVCWRILRWMYGDAAIWMHDRGGRVTLNMAHIVGPITIENVDGKPFISGNMSRTPPIT